ncbi:hypothetical protein TSUD_213460 [Trifolium subterraneum]|uniref:Pre-mRNA-splicing factor 38 n=1 Tax=Trifolium subterraneum TaxID=3900 RepID=A0A2Z6NZ78_TRISU|nr:hypothetical protein TSUD_213460 [Trifolium subterraneum]
MEIQTSGRPIESLLEKVLCMNILSSDYFKELYRLKTYHEVIDEIYNQVDHVEPWMTGNCRGPSTAFCLLYKFFTMKLTVKQMHGLLKHPDSPYIRAVGFLYLRYYADPKTLWSWFEPYAKDDEDAVFQEFSPGSNGRMTTMGVYIRDLLLGQYYFDTLFPRIPVPVMRQVVANLEKMKLPTTHCGTTGETTRHGSDDTARRPPSVKAALSVSFGQHLPVITAVRAVNILKGIGTGSGHAPGTGTEKGTGTVKGTGNVIGTDIMTGIETRTVMLKDTGTETGIGIMRGTEPGGIGTERGVMIMIGDLSMQKGKVAEIMTTLAMVVGTIVVEVAVEVGAGAEVRAKLAPHDMTHVIIKELPTWKEFLEGIIVGKRLLDLVALLGSIERYHRMLVSDVG